MGELVPTKQQAIFKKDHELKKLVSSLKKISKKAIETLEKGLDSQDERVRMIAAEKLLKFYVDTANEVNADELKRLLLEVKASGLIGAGSTAQNDDDIPALDFDNISEEFRDAPVIDMGTVNSI
jgi:oligoendopeptidase F